MHGTYSTNASGNQIEASMFGSIYTTFTTLENFANEGGEYQVGIIRWPGGSLAEGKTQAQIVYSMDELGADPETNSLDQGKGLSNTLDLASTLDRSFSLIIPTLPIFSSGKGLTGQEKDDILDSYATSFSEFVMRVSSRYDLDSFEKGISGSENSFILEIGNETSHLGWNQGSYNEEWNYGSIAASILNAAHHMNLDDHDINYEIAIQMGANVGGALRIIDTIQALEEQYGDHLFSQIDSLVSHNMLVFQASDFDVQQESEIIDAWMSAISAADSSFDEHVIELYASAWSVGDHRFGSNIFTSELSFDLATSDDFQSQAEYHQYQSFLLDLDGNDTGARQAAGTLDVFSKMIGLGYDAAALWGTVDPSNHSNSYQSPWTSLNWNQSDESHTTPLSHGGMVLAAMADRMIGYSLVDGGSVSFDAEGGLHWRASYFDFNAGHGFGEVNSYVFSDGPDQIIWSSVTDIDGIRSTSDGSLDYTFDIPAGAGWVSVLSITTEFRLAEWQQFRDNPENDWFFEDLSHQEITEFRRLFETPVVNTSLLNVSGLSEFEYTFTSDFETVMFEFIEDPNVNYGSEEAEFGHSYEGDSLDNILSAGGESDLAIGGGGNDSIFGGAGNDSLNGGANHDVLRGGAGADTLNGHGGNDRLFGGFGDDRIFGGAGQDVLGGAAGDDFLQGGSGNDRLWGNVGDDTLLGGAGDDTLGASYGDDLIWGGSGDDRVWGSAGDDTVYGGSGNDHVGGFTGNDSVVGGAGNDLVFGGVGDDTLEGGAGDDAIYGGSDDDMLEGGSGNDLLFGGEGEDTFIFGSGFGRDEIRTFSLSDSDVIRLDDALWSGDLSPQDVVEDFASLNGSGNIEFQFGNNSFELTGVSTTAGLSDAIQIF